MKKLAFVLPHCSTGGMPQYTLKLIEHLKDEFEITVIEVENYSDEYVVQRDKIRKLVPFLQMFADRTKLLKLLQESNFDIVHFQEIPETFISAPILKNIYNPNRNYAIVVTTHSSLSNKSSFKYLPDRIVAVNDWQKNMFETELKNVEVEVWEYPIEKRRVTKKDREIARGELEHFSFNENKGKHILNVGLFTPGKNQGELFEIARKNPNNYYHFVGNQSEFPKEFSDYWKPLMANKPENCFVWGERSDIENFYLACDEMYFASKFELNPLCVKEALSYKMPVTMRRLPTYGDFYDKNKLVSYIK
jgi:hypothetical protein